MRDTSTPWRTVDNQQQHWIVGSTTVTLFVSFLLFYNLTSCSQATTARTRTNATTTVASEPRARPHPGGSTGCNKTYPEPYASHIKNLCKKLPPGFTVVMEPPFVVVGDEAPHTVHQRSTHTVRWSVTQLKHLYFPKDPDHIITVWLFANKTSYVKHNWKFFAEVPSTPFGYYSERHKALIMNIATGGGTLVHEIVHPFVAANFPQCPAWFNEGMGSLYEQCAERNGKIVGLTNWRLEGLQRAIRSRILPSFKTLTHTTTTQFYDEDPGSHYAQARYLLYYLQEKRLLLRYYREFTQHHRRDPTGYKTLQRVLGTKNIASFQKKWERWVLKLRY